MAKRKIATDLAKDISAALPHRLRLPSGRAWIDYDEEADVLYVSLKRPQRVTDTVERDGILLRYRGDELVGLTILGASKRAAVRKASREISREGRLRMEG